MTTHTTPDYLLPRHRAGLRFLDISEAVNRYVARLRADGVRAIVVLAHFGAREQRGPAGARGEILDEAAQMSDEVDVVIAGHTHSHLDLELPNRSGDGAKLVVEARSFGVAYDQVDLQVDRRSGEVVSKSALTPTTWSDEVEPEPRLAALVRRYARRVAPLARRLVGGTPRRLPRPDSVPMSPPHGLGTLVAEAQRELAGAEIAFVHAGNIRAGLERGALTNEDLFAVAPYEHEVIRMDLRGSDILRLLERPANPEPAVWLYTSGLRWQRAGEGVGGVVMADGRPLRPTKRYSVAANELLVGRSASACSRSAHGKCGR